MRDRLWSQAALPLLNPVEMASTPAILRARLQEGHAAQWTAIFDVAPETVTDDDRLVADFGKVMAAYQSTLLTGESRFDRDVQRFVDLWDQGKGLVQSDPAHLGSSSSWRRGTASPATRAPRSRTGSSTTSASRTRARVASVARPPSLALLASPLRGDGSLQ